MEGHDLSDRKKQILKAIVEAHIAYGEPVGSKYLATQDQLSCSSATIRNEMAELKSLGYLEQPHTSAGSVPTEAGYRFYVNQLLDRYQMTRQEIREMSLGLTKKLNELDQILAEASRMASMFTNYPSIAAKPKAAGATVTQFETMYIDSSTFALVMLFPGGTVKTKRIRTAFPLTREELATLTDLLNRDIAGHTSDEISLPVILSIEDAMGVAAPVVNPLIKLIYETMQEYHAGDLGVEGANRLRGIPDYSDLGEVRSLLHLFEQKDDLLDVISDDTSDDIHVRIGHETAMSGMEGSSIVWRTIRSGDRVLGAIGVIGPRRMDYGKVISVINHLALGIDNLLGDPGGKNPS